MLDSRAQIRVCVLRLLFFSSSSESRFFVYIKILLVYFQPDALSQEPHYIIYYKVYGIIYSLQTPSHQVNSLCEIQRPWACRPGGLFEILGEALSQHQIKEYVPVETILLVWLGWKKSVPQRIEIILHAGDWQQEIGEITFKAILPARTMRPDRRANIRH